MVLEDYSPLAKKKKKKQPFGVNFLMQSSLCKYCDNYKLGNIPGIRTVMKSNTQVNLISDLSS